MASYTYNTTPVREAALMATVALLNAEESKENERRVARNEDPLPLTTKEQYWTTRNDEFLDSYGREHKNEIVQLTLSKYSDLNDTQKLAALNILGLGDLQTVPLETQKKILAVVGTENFLSLPHDQMNELFNILGIGG
jgi:hypothetical protein